MYVVDSRDGEVKLPKHTGAWKIMREPQMLDTEVFASLDFAFAFIRLSLCLGSSFLE